jgi:hypothetical protein
MNGLLRVTNIADVYINAEVRRVYTAESSGQLAPERVYICLFSSSQLYSTPLNNTLMAGVTRYCMIAEWLLFPQSGI